MSPLFCLVAEKNIQKYVLSKQVYQVEKVDLNVIFEYEMCCIFKCMHRFKNSAKYLRIRIICENIYIATYIFYNIVYSICASCIFHRTLHVQLIHIHDICISLKMGFRSDQWPEEMKEACRKMCITLFFIATNRYFDNHENLGHCTLKDSNESATSDMAPFRPKFPFDVITQL